MFSLPTSIIRNDILSAEESLCYNRSRAGWNPVVLTLETAKQHPDFQKISVLLDGPFGEYDVRRIIFLILFGLDMQHTHVKLISSAILFSSLVGTCGSRRRLCSRLRRFPISFSRNYVTKRGEVDCARA
jgi:hypothetical protein